MQFFTNTVEESDKERRRLFEPQRNYSVEDFWDLVDHDTEQRHEYWDGQIKMMTGGSLNHERLISSLNALLYPHIEPTACILHTDAYVLVRDGLWLCPDLVVSCEPKDVNQPRNITAPRLVIEVLSPSTVGEDRGEKAEKYRSLPTVQEYLLVDSQRVYAELYRRESQKLWTLHVFSAGDTIELRTIDIRLDVDRLYLKTSLK